MEVKIAGQDGFNTGDGTRSRPHQPERPRTPGFVRNPAGSAESFCRDRHQHRLQQQETPGLPQGDMDAQRSTLQASVDFVSYV